MAKQIVYVENPDGIRGKQVKCSCGWSDFWQVLDGSAEAAGEYHECGERPGVPPRQLPSRTHAPEVLSYPPDDWEPDSCTCFITAPCGWCENQWEEQEND